MPRINREIMKDAFVGVVVQPKTKAPIYVVLRGGSYRTIDIVGRRRDPDAGWVYQVLGTGYLDSTGSEYLAATRLSGLPRAHTPSGVQIQGGGYGTCLYTGLVLLAVCQHDKLINLAQLAGSGYGICSSSSERSDLAQTWWEAAVERGLATEDVGEAEEHDADEEEVDVLNYFGPRVRTKLREAVEQIISEHGDWQSVNVDSINCTVQGYPQSDGDEFTYNTYLMDAAEEHKLVALIDVTSGGLTDWMRQTTNVFDTARASPSRARRAGPRSRPRA